MHWDWRYGKLFLGGPFRDELVEEESTRMSECITMNV